MRIEFRTIAVSAAAAIVVAGTLAIPAFLPQVLAGEPQQLASKAKDIFPPPFDPSKLRKYDIALADSVSTEPLRTQYVRKIAFGRPSTVTIITTSSGTYSSDAITSPYVRYPGIDVAPKYGWPSFHVAISTSPAGTFSWTVINSGSFTYYNSSFMPAKRR